MKETQSILKSSKLVFFHSFIMNLKELQTLNREPSFAEERRQIQKELLIALTLGGSLIVIIWKGFDRLNSLENTAELFWLRAITIGVCLLNLFVALFRGKSRAYKQHLVAGFYFGAIYCMLLCVFTGASQSPYWYGLLFILIAWFIMAPYGYRELILHGAVFIFIFIIGIYAQREYEVVHTEMSKIILLYVATLMLGSFSAVNRNRMEALKYKARYDIKKANEELLSANEGLQEKQQFIDTIISNAPIVIWSIDLQGNFTFSQGKGLEKLGIKPDANKGKPVMEVYRGTPIEGFIRKVLNEGITGDVIKLGDVLFDTRVSPLYNSEGEKNRVYGGEHGCN